MRINKVIDVKKLKKGSKVFWNDPDFKSYSCDSRSKYIIIDSITIKGKIITIKDNKGIILECYKEDLSSKKLFEVITHEIYSPCLIENVKTKFEASFALRETEIHSFDTDRELVAFLEGIEYNDNIECITKTQYRNLEMI